MNRLVLALVPNLRMQAKCSVVSDSVTQAAATSSSQSWDSQARDTRWVAEPSLEGDLLGPGSNLGLLESPALAGVCFLRWPPQEPLPNV